MRFIAEMILELFCDPFDRHSRRAVHASREDNIILGMIAGFLVVGGLLALIVWLIFR